MSDHRGGRPGGPDATGDPAPDTARPRRGRARRPRPRTFLARQAVRLAERWLACKLVPFEHPPGRLEPRYGHGRPPHAPLLEILRRDEDSYRRNLELLAGYREDLLRIDRHPGGGTSPWWLNRWLPGLDAAALYGFLRARSPRSYFEVGSGLSTLWAARAIADGGLSTRITSIDPQPRDARAEALCDRALRTPLEALDLALFDDLRAGDVLFMDGSHRVHTNSDATVFFLDVLPALPGGVLVGIHDILLPDDYLPEWTEWYWSEQYLMAAYLLAEGERFRLELASSYVTSHSRLCEVLAPLWSSPRLEGVDRRGFGLWLTTTGR